jgi:hypothetical protein
MYKPLSVGCRVEATLWLAALQGYKEGEMMFPRSKDQLLSISDRNQMPKSAEDQAMVMYT